jgi:hypothetical protein
MRKKKEKKVLTQEEKIFKRKEQNRINQRNCRLRKNTLNVIQPDKTKTPTKEDYIKYFSQFEYDYYLVGTLKPKNNKPQSIHTLWKYTTKYLNHLLTENKIERSVVSFEGCNDNHLHVNMVIKTTDKLNDPDCLKHLWLKGGTKLNKLDNPFDIEKVINYIFKEVELNPKNRIELDKLDYWFITGDWERS